MDLTDVTGVTDLTDRRKKEEGRRKKEEGRRKKDVSKNIFPKTKSAPIFRSAFCLSVTKT